MRAEVIYFTIILQRNLIDSSYFLVIRKQLHQKNSGKPPKTKYVLQF